MNTNNYISFKVDEVELKGSNLIEASAGTGKTYSIAILTLRLILSGISVNEILMVTFTKKAVAELETRIRDFIRSAREYVNGGATDEILINDLVDRAKLEYGIHTVVERLNNAIILLDETSIQTIHSFCQRTLTEYAFETGQIFGSSAMTEQDQTDLIEDALNKFWRSSISTLDKEILKEILTRDFSRKSIRNAVKNAMSGKILFSPKPYTPDFLAPLSQKLILENWKDANQMVLHKISEFIKEIDAEKDELVDAMKQNSKARTHMKEHIDNFSAIKLYEFLVKNKNSSSKYIYELFQTELDKIKGLDEFKNQINNLPDIFINQLYQYAINVILKYTKKIKEDKSWITFDDMIHQLHNAVVIKNDTTLQESLRIKYKAVFIDEFQDTDKLQYEIFQKLFGSKSILFYIGDPKQSIYAFRKADIYTYFKASENVSSRYSMNTNYRSSNRVIQALNHFFIPEQGFDTFCFENRPEGISYVAVEPPKEQDRGELQYKGNPVEPVIIQQGGNKDSIAQNTVATVVELLNDPSFTLPDKENKRRRIKPSDFGILVRDKFEAQNIKKLLAQYNIPSITIDDTKILNTPEAKDLQFILEAVTNISPSSVHKALLISLTGLHINDLLKLDEVAIMEQFRKYQQSWQQQGIFVMLMQFIADYQVRSRLLSPGIIMGERKLANIIQLIELFHKMEKIQDYAPLELLNWLRRSIEDDQTSGDEYEQRIESDGENIEIITIHKSKGLEYNIVMAPYLDLLVKDSDDLLTFRDTSSEEYYFLNKSLLSNEQMSDFQLDAKQENRRLIYVALTRAKHACYLNFNTHHTYKESALRPFIDSLKNDLKVANEKGIIFKDSTEIPKNYRYNSDVKTLLPVYARADHFKLLQPNWKKLSYSFLNPDHQPIRTELVSYPEDPYDQFVFHDLKKGAHTGNLIHYILERIDFSDSSGWEKIITQALKRLTSSVENGQVKNLSTLLEQVMQVEVETKSGEKFCLSSINFENRLTELEFDFGVTTFQSSQIEQLSQYDYPISVRNFTELEGIMNGKMDLFFECNGKYYILDWKTNHLGYQLDDYNANGILRAMEENNYHLQYTLYTLALVKYLRLRLPTFDYTKDFGGVIYVFLRGVRSGKKTGLFVHKPKIEMIHELENLLLIKKYTSS